MNNPADGGRDQALEDMIETVDRQIGIARGLSCGEALVLLQMTKLALQMERHAISGPELKAFCTALEDSVPSAQTLNPAYQVFAVQDPAGRRGKGGPPPAKRGRGQ